MEVTPPRLVPNLGQGNNGMNDAPDRVQTRKEEPLLQTHGMRYSRLVLAHKEPLKKNHEKRQLPCRAAGEQQATWRREPTRW
jgi:hypothetical protein